MNQVQVEQRNYQMPPQDGFTVAHFLTVADIERSARFYETVFGARILSRGDSSGAPGYIQMANTWLIVNVGGGPTPDKPSVTLSVPADRDSVSSFMMIRVADIHKTADRIGIGGDAERYRWFVRCRTAPNVDNEPRVRDLDVPRRAAAVAFAQNATSEDRFVKSSRSFDVGDGEKVCDGKPILRRHLIGFLLDLYLVHRRLQFGYGISPLARIRPAVY